MEAPAFGPFTEEQKQYMQGFMTGMLQQGGVPFVGMTSGGKVTNDPSVSQTANMATAMEPTVYGTPVDDLSKEERIKYDLNGLDVWERMTQHALEEKFPEGGDVFRFKFHGMFFVSPAQESYMCRLRIPACELRSSQMRGIAEIAERWGGGYADITTRGNFQVREIGPGDTLNVFEKLYDIGLTSRGSGADNIRNITASPTSGFDKDEVYDGRRLAHALHHLILNCRELYGLPRKFNVSFDNGGAISVAADTNDIGFVPVVVPEGRDVEPGIYFRVQLGGITGHKTFARDCGLLIKPGESVALTVAMIRVFIENGDRTNRKKARLKYLLEKWGFEKFLEETQEKLDFKLRYFPLELCEQRRPVVRHAHVGVHPQREAGTNYVGVLVPVGRMEVEQMRQIADIADEFGRGDIRLTVFQNLLIPHVKDADVEAVKARVIEAGFQVDAGTINNGLVACTGNQGCKFAAANTKGHAVILGKYLQEKVPLEKPINIHLTGCAHSCAQHYCGDIGMQAVGVPVDGVTKEGYNIVLGGGMDHEQGIARDFYKGVAFEDIPPLLERVLKTYEAKKNGDETFIEFTRRHEVEALKAMVEEVA